MATLNFDANTVEPNAGFSPLPAGKYLAVITEDEMKESARGRYLQLKFEVIEGEYNGRNLWARLNLEHENPKAVQIARGDLSAICRAVGVMQLRDSVELLNIPLVITVRCKVDANTNEMRNEIKGYEPRNAAAPAAVAAPQTAKAPWAR